MATLTGTNGNDNLQGTNGADQFSGLGGDDSFSGLNGVDTITGGDGNDRLDGGNGGDTIDGGNGLDTLLGGEGNDRITGGAGDDQIDAGGGEDTVDGGDGNDTILGGTGVDQILGGAGNDTIDGGEGGDTQDGGAGDDRIIAGIGNDRLIGGAGNDTFVFAPNNGGDTVVDFSQGDKIDLSAFGITSLEQVDLRQASAANVVMTLEGSRVTFQNVNINDLTADRFIFAGGQQGEGQVGGGSTASVVVADSNDHLTGSSSNDELTGHAGNDILDGGAGNDFLTGGAGADSFLIHLAEGNDEIADFNGADGDTVDLSGTGITSFDQLNLQETDNGVVLSFGDGQTLTFDGLNLTDLSANNFIFAQGDDTSGDDRGDEVNEVHGTRRSNTLTGTDGIDHIFGEAGNDRLTGGAGDDTLTGGAGRDRFIFTAGSGNDTITDFGHGDKVDLREATTAASFNDLHFQDTDHGAVLTLDDGSTITFEGVEVNDLNDHDFLL